MYHILLQHCLAKKSNFHCKISSICLLFNLILVLVNTHTDIFIKKNVVYVVLHFYNSTNYRVNISFKRMNFSGFQFLKFIYCNVRYTSLQKAIGLVLFFNSGRLGYFTTYSNHLVSGDASWWNSQIKLYNTISRSRRHLFYHFRWQHHMITIRQSCYKIWNSE